jgi:hypothetical protein
VTRPIYLICGAQLAARVLFKFYFGRTYSTLFLPLVRLTLDTLIQHCFLHWIPSRFSVLALTAFALGFGLDYCGGFIWIWLCVVFACSIRVSDVVYAAQLGKMSVLEVHSVRGLGWR